MRWQQGSVFKVGIVYFLITKYTNHKNFTVTRLDTSQSHTYWLHNEMKMIHEYCPLLLLIHGV